MACRNCSQNCNCFTANGDTTIAEGNGSQSRPFTFRPDYTPWPRPVAWRMNRDLNGFFGGAGNVPERVTGYDSQYDDPDTWFIAGDISMMTPVDSARITALNSGVFLVGAVVTANLSTLDYIDSYFIRKNGTTDVSIETYVNNTTVTITNLDSYSSFTTLIDLEVNDYLELFIVRNVGTGSASTDQVIFYAYWMGEGI